MRFEMNIKKWLKGIFCKCELEEIDNLTIQGTRLKQELFECKDNIEVLVEKIGRLKQTATPFEQFLNQYPKVRLIYTKRWIFNKSNTYRMDIRDFLRYSETLPKLKTLQEVYTLPLRYVYDNYKEQGILDYWQTPEETWKLRASDCEDASCLRYVLSKQAGFDVAIALGFIRDTGHAFTLRRRDDGKIFILEATNNKFKPIAIPDNFPETNNYKIYYIITGKQAYQIRYGVKFGEEVRTEFGLEVG